MRFLNPEGLRQVSREEMKLLDTIAMESFQVSGSALMETAGLAVAEAACDLAGSVEGRRIGILCGTGNNGGDGLVAARFLSNWKADVRVLLVGRGPAMADPDASGALHAVQRMGMPLDVVQTTLQLERALAGLADRELWIDAIFGTGLSAISSSLREPSRTLISRVNETHLPVLAVDIPSGLDANTGEKIGVAIRANLTLTMGLPKKGFFVGEGPSCTGKVLVADLGYPRMLLGEREGLYLYRKPAKPKEGEEP